MKHVREHSVKMCVVVLTLARLQTYDESLIMNNLYFQSLSKTHGLKINEGLKAWSVSGDVVKNRVRDLLQDHDS